MFNFDSHEIKKDFSKDAVFEVKFAEVEFEFLPLFLSGSDVVLLSGVRAVKVV